MLKKIFLPLIFTVSGLIAIAISAVAYIDHQNFLKTATFTDGTVINLVRQVSEDSDGNESVTYAPEVTFRTQNNAEITFISNTSSQPPSYDVGDTIPVAYQAARPNQARVNDNSPYIFVYIGIGLGGMSLSLGLILFGLLWRKHRLSRRLARDGIRLEAQTKSIALNTSYSFNNRNPYQITAEYFDQASNTVYSFTSDHIWFDPTNFVGQTVPVIVDPHDYTKYVMDISFLPKTA